ncbi:NAD-dependent epimerase/dehydratase family protein [Inquilinus limosus]|uniref:NAD-dependent epimerase/dehydratase family protein n=1 Tax=Inquilinus limosus TaxID=171674 RepID=UPI0003F9DD85|nr:NAD-dependent epimerase/dehydratase family protein [Inquilinus limosus]
MDRKVALVVGAQGVIGRNLVQHLATLEDWNVIGLSRRGGEPEAGSGTWRSTCSTPPMRGTSSGP